MNLLQYLKYLANQLINSPPSLYTLQRYTLHYRHFETLVYHKSLLWIVCWRRLVQIVVAAVAVFSCIGMDIGESGAHVMRWKLSCHAYILFWSYMVRILVRWLAFVPYNTQEWPKRGEGAGENAKAHFNVGPECDIGGSP